MSSALQDDESRASALLVAHQRLFPPHPSAHNRLISFDSEGKSAPLVERGATQADYLAHLSPDAYDGVGALGMYPTLCMSDGQGKGRWFSSFMALDFDNDEPLALQTITNTFEGYGIYSYATCGTTGRGSHLYFFPDEPMPQRLAYNFLRGAQTLAIEAGLSLPEMRPSNEYARGTTIFLPYRGALNDGFGYNPLLDPERDFTPLRLEAAIAEVQHTTPQAFMAFQAEVREYRPAKAARPQNIGASYARPGIALEDAFELLQAEFERVAPSFVSPHRQDLVMGLTAYALVGLGLDEALVRKELNNFVMGRDPDEASRRRSAVDRTIKNFGCNPRSVAWRSYYTKVGLSPPGKLNMTVEVRAKLDLADDTFRTHPWRGTAGATDRSVYAALLLIGEGHGTGHEQGVAVSVSTRDLALKAGVSDKAVRNSLARLKAKDLVVRDTRRRRSLEDAGTLVLVTNGVSEIPQSIAPSGGQREWGYLYTHPAFMHGKLGKGAAPLLIVLAGAGCSFTRPELARALGKQSRDVRRPLAKLVAHGLVSELRGTIEISPDWAQALERAAIVTGAQISQKRQRAVHAQERAWYRERLSSRQPVPYSPLSQPVASFAREALSPRQPIR